jgi:3-oxoacyl-[acyl-carrier protein] reductase
VSRRTVLVTGSSRGIGRASAVRLAEEGFDLVLHGRTPSAALEASEQAVRAAGAQVRSLHFDVTDRAAAESALTADIEAHGACYGVVCNAGLTRDGAFPALTGEDWDQVLRTNLDGLYNVLHPLIMPMIRSRRGGRIVTLSSVSGVTGNRGQVNYSASKGGIIAATKALAVELASRKITANCVAPGPIATDMVEGAMLEQILPMIPAGRLGEASEVAGLIAFLFRDEAAYITRQVIGVNGGMV